MSKHAVVVLLVFFMAAQVTATAVAQNAGEKTATTTDKYSIISGDSLLANNSVLKSNKLWQQGVILERKLIRTVVTGYTSSADETDSTPNITASGTYTHDGVVASNFLPIGSKIRIPKLFGAKVFTVEDRMNERFTDRIDIWFATKVSALNLGLRTVDIEVL